jgi:hypothetical protein
MTKDRNIAARSAYEEDLRRRPTYFSGGVRPCWELLADHIKESWRRNPKPRDWAPTATMAKSMQYATPKKG